MVLPEPAALAKCPVPPIIVQEPVISTLVAEVGQPTSFVEANTLSPFAAVKVSCSVAVNPPWHADAGPVLLAMAANVVSPRCSRWPVAVIVALFCIVKVKLPEKLPLKGLECEANATGNTPSTATTARIAGITIIFFILILTPPSLVHRHRRGSERSWVQVRTGSFTRFLYQAGSMFWFP